MDDMAEAVMRQMDRRGESMRVDRRGWTPAQWIEDARRLMDEADGAVTSLVNGHVLALLAEVKRLRVDLRDSAKHGTILHAAAAKLDAQAAARGEGIHDYTDLLRIWASDSARWCAGE